MNSTQHRVISPFAWRRNVPLTRALLSRFAGISNVVVPGAATRAAGRVRKFLILERLARIVSDVIIVNVSYVTALVSCLFLGGIGGIAVTPREQLGAALGIYLSHFWLLTAIALTVYTFSGFYTRGPLYRGRLKHLLILEAVSLAYVLFAFVQYVSMARGWMVTTPWVAMMLGWGLTLVATTAARLWSILWRIVVQREKPLRPELNRKGPIRRVLVIGGAGYIGSVLCRRLLNEGYSVRVLDALLYGNESLSDLQGHPDFELIVGDSRDIGSVFSAMLGADAVVHLGELVGDPACALDEDLTIEINLAATRMLAEAARGYGVKRFIYASSCSVYGAADAIVNEESDLNPVSLYARTKGGSEKTLLELEGDNFHPVILRLSTVYGLSYRPRFDLVVNLLTAKAVRGGEITVFGGDQWRPFVHVADVTRAMVMCLQAPLAVVKGQIFNVGGDGHNYTIRQIGELAQKLVPGSRLVSNGDKVDQRDYRVSFAKIHDQLGFTCERTVESGMREITEALRDGRILDYRLARYNNHQTLSDQSMQPGLRSRHISDLYKPVPRMPSKPRTVVSASRPA